MRALLVSWLFPPHGSIGAKRAYRFARHLPALGWDVTVLCGRAPPAHLLDGSAWPLPPGARVAAEYDPAWLTAAANRLDALARRGARGNPRGDAAPPADASGAPPAPLARSRAARALAAVGRLAHDALPTETIAAHLPHALGAARRICAREQPDVVWTTSYPYSAHALGVHLKRRFGIPFVADLRDPWTLSFVHEAKLPHARWVERRLEAWVFAHADRVTVTTESLAEAYRAAYPALAHKFVAVRNGFDPVPLPPRTAPEGPARLLHFGHVYGARTLGAVFDALAALRARGALAPGALVLENYGRLSDADRDRVAALGLSDVVRALDPVPYTEGLGRLRRASLLLLPAWGTARGRLFLPGKLYDYLLAGAPILALGDNPELGAILARTRAGVLVPGHDAGAVADVVARVLDGTFAHAPDPAAVDEFSAPRAAARLAALFTELVGGASAMTRPAGAPAAGATP